MTTFTLQEIALVRRLRRSRRDMRDIQSRLWPHTREEVNEAWWATLRHEHDAEAKDHANRCIWARHRGMPLINGKPQAWVATNWPQARTV